mmetsp:Transcript_12041/g.29384  ORF Transcript_12041/g.29384 Transcript_12041/m.29384 type:complete len:237 (+) Transcript_12041:218-928(+)
MGSCGNRRASACQRAGRWCDTDTVHAHRIGSSSSRRTRGAGALGQSDCLSHCQHHCALMGFGQVSPRLGFHIHPWLDLRPQRVLLLGHVRLELDKREEQGPEVTRNLLLEAGNFPVGALLDLLVLLLRLAHKALALANLRLHLRRLAIPRLGADGARCLGPLAVQGLAGSLPMDPSRLASLDGRATLLQLPEQVPQRLVDAVRLRLGLVRQGARRAVAGDAELSQSGGKGPVQVTV